MKVKMKVSKRWSINYKTLNLQEGETYEVPDHVGAKIIEMGYGEEPEKMIKTEEQPKKKEALVTENKAIESTEENKGIESKEEIETVKGPKKRGPKSKK